MAKVWIWICPLCNAMAKKVNTHRKALHYAKWHMIREHDIQHGEPVIERVI